MAVLQSILGLLAFTAIAWLISENRRAAKLRVAVVGIGLQLLIATVQLKVGPARFFFIALNEAVYALERATVAGTSFVFGYRGGGALPFEVTAAGSSFVLAFRSLPLILVVSALTAWRRSQAPWTLQRGLGWCMAPVAWLMGVPWVEAPSAGSLLGIKTVLNELLA